MLLQKPAGQHPVSVQENSPPTEDEGHSLRSSTPLLAVFAGVDGLGCGLQSSYEQKDKLLSWCLEASSE